MRPSAPDGDRSALGHAATLMPPCISVNAWEAISADPEQMDNNQSMSFLFRTVLGRSGTGGGLERFTAMDGPELAAFVRCPETVDGIGRATCGSLASPLFGTCLRRWACRR